MLLLGGERLWRGEGVIYEYGNENGPFLILILSTLDSRLDFIMESIVLFNFKIPCNILILNE